MQRRGLDEDALAALAQTLGAVLEGGEVLFLEGPLGAGKTTFVRALGAALGLDAPGRVCSPTFTVCMVHEGRVPLMHVDLYRLGEAGPMGAASAAFEALDLEAVAETLSRPPVVAVEWPEYFDDPLADRLEVRLAYEGPDRRRIEARAVGPVAAARLAAWRARAAPPSGSDGAPGSGDAVHGSSSGTSSICQRSKTAGG